MGTEKPEWLDVDGEVVLSAGIEPARPCDRGILSPLRLPVPP